MLSISHHPLFKEGLHIFYTKDLRVTRVKIDLSTYKKGVRLQDNCKIAPIQINGFSPNCHLFFRFINKK